MCVNVQQNSKPFPKMANVRIIVVHAKDFDFDREKTITCYYSYMNIRIISQQKMCYFLNSRNTIKYT